jgi:hypothetical protein
VRQQRVDLRARPAGPAGWTAAERQDQAAWLAGSQGHARPGLLICQGCIGAENLRESLYSQTANADVGYRQNSSNQTVELSGLSTASDTTPATFSSIRKVSELPEHRHVVPGDPPLCDLPPFHAEHCPEIKLCSDARRCKWTHRSPLCALVGHP